ncbi:MAG TPA: energy transducer TonB [Gemmatimonadaceae bacterium]
MLNVLLESKAQHTHRVGGTLASALVHGAIITTAVLLTVQQPHVLNKPEPPQIIHVFPTPPEPPAPQVERPAASRETLAPSPVLSMPIPVIDKVPTTIQPVDQNLAPIQPVTLPSGPALPTGGPAAGPAGSGGSGTEAIDAQFVEKPPRVLRSENPRFPDALRARGLGGRIVVQFVVDTLGRAEMNDFKVVDATDALLADAVRAVLPRFRFTAGEAGGRKVRTMVALPFDFTLVR